MKIIIKAINIELTPAIKEYTQKKIGSLAKYLKNFNPELTKAEVELGKTTFHHRQGEVFKAEVNLNLEGKLLRAEEVGESLLAAIDLVRDALVDNIKHYKEKKLTKFIRGARSWKKFWQISYLARFRPSKIKKVIRRR